MALTVGSLFSGIGGIDIACEWAGMEVIWQCEIDPFCCKVLQKHWPEVTRYGDIRQLKNPPRPDVIVGGFPCQPFSNAGKRRGKEDDRYLWPEMLRIIQETKPRWVVGENVAGLINMVEFEYTLTSLENEGYEVQPVVIPACGVGANHRRDRVFIIAHTNGNISGSRRAEPEEQQRHTRITESSHDVAYADTTRKLQPKGSIKKQRGWIGDSGKDVANTQNTNRWRSDAEKHAGRRDKEIRRCSIPMRGIQHWEVEPRVGRVADGIPDRVHRLKALGNAVVPQQIYPILQTIADIEGQVR